MLNRYLISTGLLEDIKNYLNITWEDEATDRKISGLIASGMSYLNGKCGAESDYELDGLPRTLLFEYVRYGRDSALDVFENNYTAMILAMQNDRAVRKYAQTPDASDQ